MGAKVETKKSIKDSYKINKIKSKMLDKIDKNLSSEDCSFEEVKIIEKQMLVLAKFMKFYEECERVFPASEICEDSADVMNKEFFINFPSSAKSRFEEEDNTDYMDSEEKLKAYSENAEKYVEDIKNNLQTEEMKAWIDDNYDEINRQKAEAIKSQMLKDKIKADIKMKKIIERQKKEDEEEEAEEEKLEQSKNTT